MHCSKQKLLIVIYGLCIRKVRRWRPLNVATTIGHHRTIIINKTCEQREPWEKHEMGCVGGWYTLPSQISTKLAMFFRPRYSFLTNRLGQDWTVLSHIQCSEDYIIASSIFNTFCTPAPMFSSNQPQNWKHSQGGNIYWCIALWAPCKKSCEQPHTAKW